jgi:hypothetical protein
MYMDQDDEMGGIEQFRKKREAEEPDFEALSPKEPEPMGALPVQPDVKAPVSNDMDFSKYMTTPEEIQAVAAQKSKNAKVAGLFDALANRERAGSFGAAFLGNIPQKSDSSKQVEAENALADAPIVAKQQALKNAMAKQALQKSAMANKKELENEAEDKNPNSPRSVLMRNVLISKGQKIDQNASYADLSKAYPAAVLKLIEDKYSNKDPMLVELQTQRLEKGKREAEEAEFKKTPEGRLEKAGGDVKQKLGFIESGLMNLDKLQDHASKGGKLDYFTQDTPIIGSWKGSSGPVEETTRLISEDIGRLASGGAINKDEESRFRNMLPKSADYDNAETVKRKISALKDELKIKAGNYGFKPEELPNYGKMKKEQAKSYSADVVKYAKDHNISTEQADAIKIQRTGGKKYGME